MAAVLGSLVPTGAKAEESSPTFIVRDTRSAAIALETAEQDLLGKEPRRGLLEVQHILDDGQDDLVVEGREQFQTRWISAPDAARRLLLRAPPAVIADYDAVVGPSARSALATAITERDSRKLFDVVARYLPSSPAVEASKWFAEAAFERGDARDAVAILRRALGSAPKDASLWRRLVDALEVAGDARGLASLEIPDDVVEAAAKGELPPLEPLLRAARERTAPLAESQREAQAAAARNATSRFDHILHPVRWTARASLPLRSNDDGPGFAPMFDEVTDDSARLFSSRRRHITPFFPALFGRTTIVADGFSVTALDLLSGRRTWSFPASDRPIPGLAVASPDRADLKGRTNLDLSHRPFVADGSVFASMETDTVYVPRYLSGMEITTYRPQRVLVALDATTGELRWRMGASSADARALDGLSVASDPVVSGGVVAAVMAIWERRWRVFFVALDARTGALRWKREIVGGQQELNLFGEPIHDLAAGTPAIADDVFYASTGLGVFAAADLRTGEIKWVSSYPANALHRVEVWYATPIRLPTFGPCPVVVYGDAVLAAPTEGSSLFCFDRADGRLRWREASEARKGSAYVDQFLGVVNDGQRDVAIVTGRSVRALHLTTGLPVWHESLEDGALARGRGALSKGTVYVPTTKGLSRWSLAAEGRFMGADPWPEGSNPGNVCLFPEVLVVATGHVDESDDPSEPSGSIEAFYDWSEIEARLAARRLESPSDAAVILDEADLWRVVGKDKEARAEALYEEGRRLAAASASDVLIERARRGIYLLRRDQGDDRNAAHRPLEARTGYERALAAAQTRDERVEIRLRLDRLLDAASLAGARVRNLEALATEADDARAVLEPGQGEVSVRMAARFLLAELHQKAGRAADAIDVLETILADDADVIYAGEPARTRAARAIGAVIREFGPESYARHEREARRRLDVALAGTEALPFERLLAEYPNATIVPGALLGLADRLADGPTPADAAPIYRRFLAAYPDRPETPATYARLARALARANRVGPARATLALLERLYPDAKLELDGVASTGAQFAAAERARLGPMPTKAPERRLSPPISERLHEAVEAVRENPMGARVLPMARTADGGAVPPVLLDVGSEIVAVDAGTGTIRFRKPWDLAGLAVCVGDSLAISRPDALVGLDAATGVERWRHPVGGIVRFLDGGIGQMLVVVRRPSVPVRTSVIALDPGTAGELWKREIRDEEIEGLLVGEDAFVLVRRRSIPNARGGPKTVVVLAIHAMLTGDAVREILLPSEGWNDVVWRLADPRTLVTATREAKGVRVEAIDLASGKTRWSKSLEGTERVRHLLSRGDAAVVIGSDGRVRAMTLANGDLVVDTAINGGVDTLFGAEPIVEGDRLYAILRTGPSTMLTAFDLATGRALWMTPTKTPVNTGWLRKDGDILVTIQAPQPRAQGSSLAHLIALVDARTGDVIHRIEADDLSGWQPSATISDGALVVGGQHAFAVYR